MTSKTKAEQLCREANPELLKKSKSCIYHLEEAGGICDCDDEKLYTYQIQPHHWARLLNKHTKGDWFVKPMPISRNELVNLRDFGTKKFKNQYIIILNDEKFYQAILNIVGV